jgi:hypothetical protein
MTASSAEPPLRSTYIAASIPTMPFADATTMPRHALVLVNRKASGYQGAIEFALDGSTSSWSPITRVGTLLRPDASIAAWRAAGVGHDVELGPVEAQIG